MAEKAVTGRDAWSRLFSELTSAIEVDAPGEERAGRARRRAGRLHVPGPRASAARPPRRVTAALQPGLRTRAYIFNTLLHDKAVEDRLRTLPDLAVEPQPRQRGQRRVGPGAGRRRSRTPTSSRGAGTGSRRACSASTASPTTTAWRRSPRPTRQIGWDEAQRHRARRLSATSPPVLGDDGASASSTGATSTRPVRPGQARRRVLRLHRPERAPLRDAQLHLASAATC